MDRCHASFAALVEARLAEDPARAHLRRDDRPGRRRDRGPQPTERRARRPTHMWTAASFGEPLPERVTRAIVLARLANLARRARHDPRRGGRRGGGDAGRRRCRRCPRRATAARARSSRSGTSSTPSPSASSCAPKERMALVNGSPCAAALVADVALAGPRRLALAEQVLALAADVLGVPLEAYGAELEPLWGDPHETAALRSLRALLAGRRRRAPGPPGAGELPHPPARARRHAARPGRGGGRGRRSRCARSPTTRSTCRPTRAAARRRLLHRRLPRRARAGGASTAWPSRGPTSASSRRARPTGSSAARHRRRCSRATSGRSSRCTWWPAGWAEEARALAQPSLLSLGGFGQNDMPSPSFLRLAQGRAVGRCLDGALAVLARARRPGAARRRARRRRRRSPGSSATCRACLLAASTARARLGDGRRRRSPPPSAARVLQRRVASTW